MKLAICSVGELFGGVERHILGMSTWLKREGHEFVLILFHDRELARQARLIGVEPVILAVRGSFDLKAPGRLADIFEKLGINLVHAHGYRAVVNCALARRRYKFSMVRTVHGLVESSGWWTRNGIKANLYTRLERYFGRRAGASVIYVTEDLRHRNGKYNQGLVTKAIHNGIDPLNREDYSRPPDLEPDIFHLAAVGRVTKVKGLEYAIRAMAQLEAQVKVRLNIIGTGPLMGELKALVGELKVDDRIRFLGFKKNVYDYLAHIDALIMPSRHEGLPYTILEAMSLEVPIIASRVGGLAEVLVDGKTAVLIEVGDVQGIADAVMNIVSDREGSQSVASKARLFQKTELSLAKMGHNYWISTYLDRMDSGLHVKKQQ